MKGQVFYRRQHLLVESKRILKKTVDELDRSQLKVNVFKSNVMICVKPRGQILILQSPLVRAQSMTGCQIWLRREKMQEKIQFQYFGTVLCTHGSMKGELVISAVERIIKGKSEHWGKEGHWKQTALSYASATWTWNVAQQLRLFSLKKFSYIQSV